MPVFLQYFLFTVRVEENNLKIHQPKPVRPLFLVNISKQNVIIPLIYYLTNLP